MRPPVKDRAHQPESERQKTGSTERGTGLEVTDLAFRIEYRDAEANEDLASVFGVPVGTRLLERIDRTNSVDEGAPFALVHSYVVHEIVAGNPDLLNAANEPWPRGAQNQLHTVGIELDRIEARITACLLTVEEAEELGIKRGVSVFLLRKNSRDIDDRVVEVSDVTLSGDRTEFVFTTPLKRW
ncbi:UTRA domain-containing protein [Streptomyces cucumeris]|uniref:UTRA domain-containing protein n=1 Tax=Streptomyces cucumeris TaxID=2962890 RepID=UPI003D70A78F